MTAGLRSLGSGPQARQQAERTSVPCKRFPGPWGRRVHQPGAAPAIRALSRSFRLHQKPQCVTRSALVTAQRSLVDVWKLSSEHISAVKRTAAPAFTPVIRLKRHHRAGLLREPETGSRQAARGCDFQRSRRDSAACEGWKSLSASVGLPSPWRNHFMSYLQGGTRQTSFLYFPRYPY